MKIRLLPYLAAGVLLLVYLAVTSPPAFVALTDRDQGNQLAKATQIALGEHPFVDFTNAVYGPLVFYSSYLAQVLSGWRFGGEIALQILGYAASYLLLFALLLRVLGPGPSAWVFVAVLVLLMPRFYKYYVVLGPACVALALHASCRAPAYASRRVWLAAAVVVAGLYRLDFGAYAGVAALLGVWLADADAPAALRLRRMATLVGVALLLVSPWLVFLVSRGDPLAMAGSTFHAALGVATGLALPAPGFDLAAGLSDPGNRLFLAWWGFRLLPLGGLAVSWRALRRGGPRADAVFGLCLSVFCALLFLQASHRAGAPHLRQVLPLQLVLLAWLATAVLPAERGPAPDDPSNAAVGLQPRRGAGGAMALALLSFWLLLPSVSLNYHLVMFQLRSLSEYDYTPEELRQPDRWMHLPRLLAARVGFTAAAASFVHQVTTPDEPVLFLPYAPQLYYLSQRGFATPFGWLNPGRFSDEADQQRFIDALGTTHVVTDEPDFAFDEDPARAARAYAPLLMRHLYRHYGIVTRLGTFLVLSDDPRLLGAQRFGPSFRALPAPPERAPQGGVDLELATLNTLAPDPAEPARMPRGGGLLLGLELRLSSPPEAPAGPITLGLAREDGEVVYRLEPALFSEEEVAKAPQQGDAIELSENVAMDTREVSPGVQRLVVLTAGDQLHPTAYRIEIFEPVAVSAR